MAKVTITWTWVSTALNYDIQYKKSVDPTWITAAGSPIFNPVAGPTVDMQIDNLEDNTLYDFRVRSNCEGGFQSAWATQSKSTDINMSLTLGLGAGTTGNESITAAEFSVDGIDSGFVLSAPIVTPDDETYQLQSSQDYVGIITLSNTANMLGALRVYVNGILQQCVPTLLAAPTDYTVNFNSSPGDVVLIEWTSVECP